MSNYNPSPATLAAITTPIPASDKTASTGIPDYMDSNKNWIGFDLDRTLAKYTHWSGPDVIGEPIWRMMDVLGVYLDSGSEEIKIFTARIWPMLSWSARKGNHFSYWDPRAALVSEERRDGALKACKAIDNWCDKYIGQRFELTNVKDIHCVMFYDDIARQVLPNKGIIVL